MDRPRVPSSAGLPLRLTRLFGRESELIELEGLVERTPLVTLVGAPGCGKTRLGVELAERLGSRFRDGVGFVDLAQVAEPAQVAGAAGLALGIREQPVTSMTDRLVRSVADAELLVVLDNCEHVAGGAAELTRALLASCPGVRVLATSRVALALHGEQVWDVPPLDVPTAMALFADRAQLVSSGFEVDAAGEADVEAICRQLDGLPLAIELVAPWARVLSPAQIVHRLGGALPALSPGAGGLAPRQETMDATVEWSYRLLDEEDQLLFDRLSVFVGGFDLAAAEAVAGVGEPADGVLRGVKSLVDHSLVRSDSVSGDRMRYRMLEPVRQCGAVRLEARGDGDAVHRRHARHYLAVTQQRAADLWGGRRVAALRCLGEDKANVVAALRWMRTHDPRDGLRLCTAWARLCEKRGWVDEARAWLVQLLDAAPELGRDGGDGGDDDARASALALAGRLAWRQWDNEQARVWLEESLAITRRVGDPLSVARRQRTLAYVAMSEGDPATAVGLSERAISVCREHGDERGLAWALISLGLARYVAGDFPDGDECLRQALTICRGTGDLLATADAYNGLAYSAHVTGSAEEREHLLAAIAALREADGLAGEPNWLIGGAGLAITEERFDAALRLAGAAEALGEHTGNRMFEQFVAPIRERLDRARGELGAVVADGFMAKGARMSLDELVAEAIAEPSGRPAGLLSPREQEVADLVVQGMTNVQIARELYISVRTVESHVDHIKRKLGVDTRQKVIAWGLR